MTALPSQFHLARPAPPPSRPLGNRPSRKFNPELAMLVARCEFIRSLQGRQAQRADVDDAVQELAAAAWQAWPRFDPSRGRARTYLANVMRRRSISMTRTRLAKKRGGFRRQRALDDVGDAIAVVDGADSILQALDIAEVVATLPTELQRVCTLLKKYSVAEVARMLGISRSALVYRVQIIGRVFEEAGFGGVQA